MVLIFLKIILKTPVLHSHSFEVFVLNLRPKYKGPELELRMGGREQFKRCTDFAQERGKWSIKCINFSVFFFPNLSAIKTCIKFLLKYCLCVCVCTHACV